MQWGQPAIEYMSTSGVTVPPLSRQRHGRALVGRYSVTVTLPFMARWIVHA